MITGAAALLLDVVLLPVGVAAEAPDDVELVFPLLVDAFVPVLDSLETVVEGAAELVGRAPPVNVTSCPPRALPPSVKLEVVAVMVVVAPATLAIPDPEHVPVNELVIVQPSSIVLISS